MVARPTTQPGFSEDASAWELVRRLCVYLGRGMRLRCPECGGSPIFVPASKTRTVRDWVTPLDGCPRCGYAYEREAGYFLIAIWGIHYFTVTGLGLALGLLIDTLFPMRLWLLVLVTAVPTVIFGFFFSRYAKALYLAIDHYFDPHVKAPKPPPTQTLLPPQRPA
jgi:uncharacterized protein (DUF983 family)